HRDDQLARQAPPAEHAAKDESADQAAAAERRPSQAPVNQPSKAFRRGLGAGRKGGGPQRLVRDEQSRYGENSEVDPNEQALGHRLDHEPCGGDRTEEALVTTLSAAHAPGCWCAAPRRTPTYRAQPPAEQRRTPLPAQPPAPRTAGRRTCSLGS